MVSAGHVGGTCGSGMVSSADDVLWMNGMSVITTIFGLAISCSVSLLETQTVMTWMLLKIVRPSMFADITVIAVERS